MNKITVCRSVAVFHAVIPHTTTLLNRIGPEDFQEDVQAVLRTAKFSL